MKIIENFLLMAVLAIVVTACTHDADFMDSAENSPLVVTASMPLQAWGVESQGRSVDENGITELKLHYTPVAAGANDVPTPFAISVFSMNNNAISFTTKATVSGSQRLLWNQIDKTQPLYLTLKKNGLEYWAKAEGVSAGSEVSFGEMKPRMSKFTVKLSVAGLSNLDADDFNLSLSDVYDAAYEAPVTEQAWPTTGTGTLFPFQDLELSGSTLSASALFAPQTVGSLVISYKSSPIGTIVLSGVAINNRTENANVFKAGEHITIIAQLNMTELTPGIVNVQGFEKEPEDMEFNGSVK